MLKNRSHKNSVARCCVLETQGGTTRHLGTLESGPCIVVYSETLCGCLKLEVRPSEAQKLRGASRCFDDFNLQVDRSRYADDGPHSSSFDEILNFRSGQVRSITHDTI